MEDESDVQAAKELSAEVRADIAEFDENSEATSGDAGADDAEFMRKKQLNEMSKIENEFRLIETEVNRLSFTLNPFPTQPKIS